MALTGKLLPDIEPGGEVTGSEAAARHDFLAAYTRLAASPLFLSLISGGLKDLSVAQFLLLWAAVFPSFPCVIAAHLAYVVNFPRTMPRFFCEDYWTFLLNLGGLMVLGGDVLLSLGARGRDREAARRSSVAEYAFVQRVQYLIIWFAVACWKSNTSFLDHRVSCASILLVELLDTCCPRGFLDLLGGAERLAGYLVPLAPGLTVVVEGGIPVLLACPGRSRRAGVVLALLLGICLGLLPYDNNASEFSVWCAVRYALFLPEATAAALAEVWALPGRVLERLSRLLPGFPRQALPDPGVSALAAAAALTLAWPHVSALVFPRLNSVTARTYLPVFTFLCSVLLRAVVLDERMAHRAVEPGHCDDVCGPRAEGAVPVRWRQVVRWMMWGLTFAYAFVGPVLGLQDIGLPHMYSNLALHGGSNHVLLPTGLLQAAANDADPAGGNPFAGGVVLVRQTNSTVILATFPAEKVVPEPHRTLLQSAGHIGRQWTPESTEILGPGVLYGKGGIPPTPYTLPALEFRRVLEQARERGEPFFLEYDRLPSRVWRPRGDEHPSGLAAQIRYEEDGRGGRWCSDAGAAAAAARRCADSELVLLPAPGASLAGRLVLKLLLSSSYAAISPQLSAPGIGCYNR